MREPDQGTFRLRHPHGSESNPSGGGEVTRQREEGVCMRLDCECGFVAQGAGDDELVAVAQAHARDAHLVDLTAEVILALAASPIAACDPSTK